ncbi:hypothetical protein ElyMa_004976900 [Elysia marginata]|uniref:Uncharacterized protein n=1 Tax=Elysia marginata TaxID=1093978 RepID=A0AAV4J4G6_9GAST|nr:hypothetical protein ElyMa_004976900 [Elysia marginata]
MTSVRGQGAEVLFFRHTAKKNDLPHYNHVYSRQLTSSSETGEFFLQSGTPSHTILPGRHLPSSQANWPGQQSTWTAHPEKHGKSRVVVEVVVVVRVVVVVIRVVVEVVVVVRVVVVVVIVVLPLTIEVQYLPCSFHCRYCALIARGRVVVVRVVEVVVVVRVVVEVAVVVRVVVEVVVVVRVVVEVKV